MVRPGEVLYIASDESNRSWFRPFDKLFGQKPVFLSDLTGGGPGAIQGLDVPEKLAGPVEQLVCAAGRHFMGSHGSTFGKFIKKLRWHMRRDIRKASGGASMGAMIMLELSKSQDWASAASWSDSDSGDPLSWCHAQTNSTNMNFDWCTKTHPESF